jgi:hypothetical protein
MIAESWYSLPKFISNPNNHYAAHDGCLGEHTYRLADRDKVRRSFDNTGLVEKRGLLLHSGEVEEMAAPQHIFPHGWLVGLGYKGRRTTQPSCNFHAVPRRLQNIPGISQQTGDIMQAR